MVRVRVCPLPVRQPRESAEQHKASIARRMRTFHAQHALPGTLPDHEHLVVTPSSDPLVVRSDGQLRKLMERLSRPLLVTLTHAMVRSTGVWCPPSCPCAVRSDAAAHQILYAVAQLSATELRTVEDRLGELLRDQGTRSFLLEVDIAPAVCIEAGVAPQSCSETGCSASRVEIESGRIYVTNDPERLRRPAPVPKCGHWAWCCPCSAVWSLVLALRPCVCGAADSRLALLHDGTGGRSPFHWDKRPGNSAPAVAVGEATSASAVSAAPKALEAAVEGDAIAADAVEAAERAAGAAEAVRRGEAEASEESERRRRREMRRSGAVAEADAAAEGAAAEAGEGPAGPRPEPDAHGMIANPAAGVPLSAADD